MTDLVPASFSPIIQRHAGALFGADSARLVVRLSRCGYALNAAHDDERERRKRDGDHSEESWSIHCKEASEAFRKGDLHAKCGKPAILMCIHCSGDVFAYCAEHAMYDLAVINLKAHLVWLKSPTQEDQAILQGHSGLAKAWLQMFQPLEEFLLTIRFWKTFTESFR